MNINNLSLGMVNSSQTIKSTGNLKISGNNNKESFSKILSDKKEIKNLEDLEDDDLRKIIDSANYLLMLLTSPKGNEDGCLLENLNSEGGLAISANDKNMAIGDNSALLNFLENKITNNTENVLNASGEITNFTKEGAFKEVISLFEKLNSVINEKLVGAMNGNLVGNMNENLLGTMNENLSTAMNENLLGNKEAKEEGKALVNILQKLMECKNLDDVKQCIGDAKDGKKNIIQGIIEKLIKHKEDVSGEDLLLEKSSDNTKDENIILKNTPTLNGDEGKKEGFFDKKEEKFIQNILSKDKPKDNKSVTRLDMVMKAVANDVQGNSPVTSEKAVPEINLKTFTKDVINWIKYSEQNGIQELKLKINPKELGEIVIKISMENGVLKGRISATKSETAMLLNSNLQNIVENLKNENVVMESLAVDVFNFSKENNEKGHDELWKKKNKSSKGEAISALNDNEDVSEENLNNNISIYA